MPALHRELPYTLRDSPFFRLRRRKDLAKLLHVSETALSTISLRTDLYVRCWKHKKEKDKWLDKEPPADVGHLYRPIDIPDRGLKVIQSRIAGLLGRITC